MSELSANKQAQMSKESLLEDLSTDHERLAVRREELESMSLGDMMGQLDTAARNLFGRLSHDPRAVFNRRGPDDEWLATLAHDGGGSSFTVSAYSWYKSNHVPRIKIYDGEASSALQRNPRLDIDPTDGTMLPAIQMGGQRIHEAANNRSLKDMQARVSDILLLEALAEQFTPDQPPVTTAQAGRVAVAASLG